MRENMRREPRVASASSAAIDRSSDIRFGALVAGTLALIAYLHRETFGSLVQVWMQTETFVHCFVVAPISAFLIWQRRHDVAIAPKRVSLVGIAATALLSFGWLLASSADVQFGQHLTVVLMIPAVVLALLGAQATKKIALPLGYLIFAVPFGEALIPTLMDITAAFTVHGLRLTGIPLLREGVYFSIPSGDFEVAKACSGIRYLIACVALGVLYSYISYRSWQKRALFIALSIVAPIV